jgi:hypothetical protein
VILAFNRGGCAGTSDVTHKEVSVKVPVPVCVPVKSVPKLG